MAKKQMISVNPIRRRDGIWQHLIIKRVTPSYNWQCVTGGVDEGETPLQAAHRELFEETGYKVKKMIPYLYDDDYFIDDEPAGEKDEAMLYKFLRTIENFVYITIVEEEQDPVLDPNEHDDWKWCDYPTAYEHILWAIEKKGIRLISEYICSNNMIFNA